MRYAIPYALTLLAACGSDGGGDITLTTKEITVMPGEESTYCYYLHTNNTEPVVVNKWVSDMIGSHHMIIYENPSGYQKADHEYDTPCPIVGRTQPIWLFSSQLPGHDEWAVPDDDGTGKPLGQLIQPNTAIFIQMHLLNHGDTPIQSHVNLVAETMPTGSDYTPTAGFMAYNNSIKILPGATNHMETATCKLPEGVQFWSMVTHSHKQTVETYIHDGDVNGPLVFQDTNWEHPETLFWDDKKPYSAEETFFKFQNPTLTWQCLYNNTGDNVNNTIYSGQSSVTDEMCVVGGFYFPATSPLACIWDTSIPEGCSCSTTGTGG